MALGGIAMFLIYYFNFSTLAGRLEFRVFIGAVIMSSLLICKRVKQIERFREDTAWGKKGSDDFVRLILSSTFSLMVAIFVVWVASSVNMVFDKSQARPVIAEVQSKSDESKLFFWSSYKLSFSADIPDMRHWRYVVDKHFYAQVFAGDKVALMIKEGALGAPYIGGVKLASNNGERRGSHDKPL